MLGAGEVRGELRLHRFCCKGLCMGNSHVTDGMNDWFRDRSRLLVFMLVPTPGEKGTLSWT